MRAWLSTMPVSGDHSAATQDTAGSSARAWAAVRTSSATPFAAALARRASSASASAASVATISLPTLRVGTPCASAQA